MIQFFQLSLCSCYFYLESLSTETVVKTEEQTESAIDMFDDEFHAIMERDFSAEKNANEASEAVRVNEEHETDSDDTEINEDYAAVSGEWALFLSFD